MIGYRRAHRSPQTVFNIPVMAAAMSGEVTTCKFLMLRVLPKQSAQVPVLANNMALFHGEDRPRHNCAYVFPILKLKGGRCASQLIHTLM